MASASEAYRYLKILVPHVPWILKSGIWHTLGLNPESSKWDAKTNLFIQTVRAVLSGSSSPVTRVQKASMKDPGIKGPVWAAPVALPVGAGDDVDQLLFEIIDNMKESPAETYTKPPLQEVTAEWQGYRAGVGANASPPPGATPAETYSKLMLDVKSPATILYIHGGAHYLMDPSTHRPVVSEVCKRSGARALNIRYRLSPQHPFPAALLDCLVGYLSLLYPAAGALHEPVKPEHIVFSGDSAGGNLCFALLAFLLQLQRKVGQSSERSFKFNGRSIVLPIPLPGGISTNSPWLDLTRSMPSLVTNHHYDYIPLPSMAMTLTPAAAAPTAGGAQAAYTFQHRRVATRIHSPGENKNPFPCPAWPEIPPRADLYIEGSMLAHPLGSPLMLGADFWTGAPPAFFVSGEEMLSDEINIVARRMQQAGVQVRWAGFEAMPHCFVMLLRPAGCAPATADRAYDVWGGWIAALMDGGKSAPLTGGTWFSAPSLKADEIDVGALAAHVSDQEAEARMREETRRRCEAYERLVAASQSKL